MEDKFSKTNNQVEMYIIKDKGIKYIIVMGDPLLMTHYLINRNCSKITLLLWCFKELENWLHAFIPMCSMVFSELITWMLFCKQIRSALWKRQLEINDSSSYCHIP